MQEKLEKILSNSIGISKTTKDRFFASCRIDFQLPHLYLIWLSISHYQCQSSFDCSAKFKVSTTDLEQVDDIKIYLGELKNGCKEFSWKYLDLKNRKKIFFVW